MFNVQNLTPTEVKLMLATVPAESVGSEYHLALIAEDKRIEEWCNTN